MLLRRFHETPQFVTSHDTSKAFADPLIKEQMLGQGNELGGGTPEQFGAFIKSEAEKWGKLVKSASIKPE